MKFPSRDSEFQQQIVRRLPELVTLERLLRSFANQNPSPVPIEIAIEEKVAHKGHEFPIYSITLGTRDKSAPCLAIVGGVHGLERIGAEVTVAWLQSIHELMQWDEQFVERMQKSRLVFMPIVNPVGIFLTRRSNGNGVDLMRNAPVEAKDTTYPLLGGHRYSNLLPWFRGHASDAASMEPEARALCSLIEREVFPAKVALSIDVHSGFGSVDRLWFPYANTHRPPRNLVELMALKRVFDRSYPNHFYRIEPQALQYTTHGDLWDWLYDRYASAGSNGVYLPWTLELGSWLWLKKNPRQLFSSLGAFNPQQPHRLRRILRRHITLFDFFHRAVLSPEAWTKLSEAERTAFAQRAQDQWYEQIAK